MGVIKFEKGKDIEDIKLFWELKAKSLLDKQYSNMSSSEKDIILEMFNYIPIILDNLRYYEDLSDSLQAELGDLYWKAEKHGICY